MKFTEDGAVGHETKRATAKPARRHLGCRWHGHNSHVGFNVYTQVPPPESRNTTFSIRSLTLEGMERGFRSSTLDGDEALLSGLALRLSGTTGCTQQEEQRRCALLTWSALSAGNLAGLQQALQPLHFSQG